MMRHKNEHFVLHPIKCFYRRQHRYRGALNESGPVDNMETVGVPIKC